MAFTYQSKGNGADGVSESEGEGDSVFSNPTLQLYLVRAPHSEPDLFRRARHGLVDFTYRRLEKLHVGRVTGGRSWRGRDSIGGSGAALSTPTTIGGVFLGLGHLWLERAWAAGGGRWWSAPSETGRDEREHGGTHSGTVGWARARVARSCSLRSTTTLTLTSSAAQEP